MDYNSTNNRIFQLKENFFANEFDPGKKHVFILGASSVAHLNSSYINQFIQDPEILVYNLAVPADRPAERLQTIDKLASAKPALVVYGLSFRDFTPPYSPDEFRKSEKPSSILPDPHDFFESVLTPKLVEPEFMKFKSPKFVTLSIVRDFLGDSKERPLRGNLTEDTPFFDFDKLQRRTISNETQIKIKIQNQSKYHPIGLPDSNIQILSLKKIINVLKDNDIKMVVYTTPYHPIFLELDSGNDHLLFESIMEDISDVYDLKIYYLHDKYTDLDIWYDASHITMHEIGNIHDEDVANLILNEINEDA